MPADIIQFPVQGHPVILVTVVPGIVGPVCKMDRQSHDCQHCHQPGAQRRNQRRIRRKPHEIGHHVHQLPEQLLSPSIRVVYGIQGFLHLRLPLLVLQVLIIHVHCLVTAYHDILYPVQHGAPVHLCIHHPVCQVKDQQSCRQTQYIRCQLPRRNISANPLYHIGGEVSGAERQQHQYRHLQHCDHHKRFIQLPGFPQHEGQVASEGILYRI